MNLVRRSIGDRSRLNFVEGELVGDHDAHAKVLLGLAQSSMESDSMRESRDVEATILQHDTCSSQSLSGPLPRQHALMAVLLPRLDSPIAGRFGGDCMKGLPCRGNSIKPKLPMISLNKENVIHICPRFVSVFLIPDKIEISKEQPFLMQWNNQIIYQVTKLSLSIPLHGP
jgi:hypothetical protein